MLGRNDEMNGDEIDVLVVGGGAAGVVAAAKIAAMGLRVAISYKSDGVSAYSSGSVDIADGLAGEIPGVSSDPFARGDLIVDAVAQLAQLSPSHPYARVSGEGLDKLGAAIALFQELSKSVSMTSRHDGKNHILLTQAGTVKRSALVLGTSCFDLADIPFGASVGIVGVGGFTGFDAQSAANMLQWIVSLSASKQFNVVPIRINFVADHGQFFRTGFSLAETLDDEDNQKLFCHKVQEAIQGMEHPPSHLFFPPVLGRRCTEKLLKDLQVATGCTTSEMLATLHSVPGLRLADALHDYLARNCVEVILGVAQAVTTNAQGIDSVIIDTEGTQKIIRPKAVVLATGRFLGGGLKIDGIARETVMGLPIWSSLRPIDDGFTGDLVGKTLEDTHEIFRVGVAYDSHLRPVDSYGKTFASNLFAAGSILEGYDPARDRSALGVAILTGYLAGCYAAEFVAKR